MKTLCCLAAIISAGAGCAAAEDYGPELPPMTGRGAPAIRGVTPSAPTVPRFGKLELTVELAAAYDNPFDPEQVDLTAEFTTPAGKQLVVPGFFCQPYRNRNAGDDSRRPLLDAVGEPCWKVRFTPTEVGKHGYVVRLRHAQRDRHAHRDVRVARSDAGPRHRPVGARRGVQDHDGQVMWGLPGGTAS